MVWDGTGSGSGVDRSLPPSESAGQKWHIAQSYSRVGFAMLGVVWGREHRS